MQVLRCKSTAARQVLTNGSSLTIAVQYLRFVNFDGLRILADIAGVVNTAGQLAKLAVFDSFQVVKADFGRLRDVVQGDSFLMTQCGEILWCDHGDSPGHVSCNSVAKPAGPGHGVKLHTWISHRRR